MNESSQEQKPQQFDYFIRLLLLGDLSVGKSSFIYRFIYDKFNPEEMKTSGLDMQSSDIAVDKTIVRVQLWDTVGEEKFKSINKNLILKVQGIILVFDITKKETFDNIETWINLIQEQIGNKIKILIVGNKIDLEEERIMKKKEAKAYFKKQKLKYVETSCKNGHNIKKAISYICKKLIESKDIPKDTSFSLNSSASSTIKKKHCCK